MREGDCELLDEYAETEAAQVRPRGHTDRRGLCRIGEALSELLALYPEPIELDAPAANAAWPTGELELVLC